MRPPKRTRDEIADQQQNRLKLQLEIQQIRQSMSYATMQLFINAVAVSIALVVAGDTIIRTLGQR